MKQMKRMMLVVLVMLIMVTAMPASVNARLIKPGTVDHPEYLGSNLVPGRFSTHAHPTSYSVDDGTGIYTLAPTPEGPGKATELSVYWLLDMRREPYFISEHPYLVTFDLKKVPEQALAEGDVYLEVQFTKGGVYRSPESDRYFIPVDPDEAGWQHFSYVVTVPAVSAEHARETLNAPVMLRWVVRHPCKALLADYSIRDASVAIAMDELIGSTGRKPPALPAPGKLMNPGAELAARDRSDRLVGVRTWRSPGIDAGFERDTSVSRGGKASFHMINEGAKQLPHEGGELALFSMAGRATYGDSYTARAWVKTGGVTWAALVPWVRNKEGDTIGFDLLEIPAIRAGDDWTSLTTTWTPLPGAAACDLLLVASGKGEAWFDDVAVKRDVAAGDHGSEFKLLGKRLRDSSAVVLDSTEPFARDDIAGVRRVLERALEHEKLRRDASKRQDPMLEARVVTKIKRMLPVTERLSGLVEAVKRAREHLETADIDFVAGWGSPARHLFLRDLPVPFEPETSGRILAVKGEVESLQLVLLAARKDLENVVVEVGELRGPGGTISAGAVEVHPVGFVNIRHTPPSRHLPLDVEHIGWWPDLILDDFPFDVRLGDTQPVWISVRVPLAQAGGTYTAQVHIRPGNAPAREIPLQVEVADYVLPASNPWVFKNVLSWFHVWPEKFYKKKWNPQLEQKFFDFLLERRINVTSIYGNEPYETLERYKEFAARGQNVFMLYKDHRHARMKDSGAAKMRARLDPVVEGLKSQGLLDRTYVYSWDELESVMVEDPSKQDDYVEEIEYAARILLEEYGGVRLFLTGLARGPYEYGLGAMFKGLPNIAYCPFMELDLEAARRARGRGNEVWWYDTDWIIDQHLIRSRLIPWQTFKLEADGFLIWCLNRWRGNDKPVDPKRILSEWDPYMDGSHYNSTAMYVYPGPDGPISSLRMENFSDGIEDYELLIGGQKMLETLADRNVDKKVIAKLRRAIAIDDSLTRNPREYTTDPGILFRHRERLIRALVAGRRELRGEGASSQ